MSDPSLDELARFSKLFAALPDDARKKLMAMSTRRAAAPGEVICKEGEDGHDFFVITKGTVTVSGDDLGSSKALATLGPGQFFGEMAALSRVKRQATVTAADAVELVCFSQDAIQEVLKVAPQAVTLLQKVGLLRTEDNVKKMME